MDNIEMVNATLSWSVEDLEGFTFACKAEDNFLVPDEWALFNVCLPGGVRASLAPIFTLIEDESGTAVSGSSVVVSHEDIAKLDNHDLKSIGLPDHMPYRLSIEGKGYLQDSDFKFSYSVEHPEGRRVMGCKRNGALLEVGKQQYIIPDPIYSLIRRMDSFNDKPPSDIEGRFYEWGALKELLPEDVQVGQHLQGLNVVKAGAFAIKSYTNKEGEPDFNPVLTYRKKTESLLSDKESIEIKDALPSARQEDFSKHFRKRKHVLSRYSAGGGYYIVLPESLRKVLAIVKRIQEETADKRIEFIKNPAGFFRAELGDEFADTRLETLFYTQEDYGERVRDIGAWQPKILPYIENFNNEWLPAPGEENIGILIDNEAYPVNKDDLPELIKELEGAIKEGKPHVTYQGKSIPATDEALKAVQRLTQIIKPDAAKQNTKRSESDNKQQIVLIIKDNLGNLEYKAKKRISDSSSDALPGSLKWKLYPHQTEGFNWLQEHWKNGSRGALLADDMGLGKTVQSLTFLAWLQNQESFQNLPVLIVAPTGLLQNWIDEHDSCLHAPGLGERLDAYGSALKNLRDINTGKARELEGGQPVLNLKKIKNVKWVLTTYETLRDYQHSFGKIHFSVLVFDEAQKVKNPSSLMTEALKGMNSDFFLALTGTPVENRLTDLWCIVDAVQPGNLGSNKEFISIYEKNMPNSETPQSQEGTFVHELSEETLQPLQRLKKILDKPPAIMMRRMKEDHLKGLPTKTSHSPYWEEMPEKQASAYKNAIDMALFDSGDKKRILETLQKLRSISLHPYLQLQEDDDEYIKASARLSKTFEILDTIKKNGQKALIFLESKKMQGILCELLQRRYLMKKAPLLINGEVSGLKRKERVDDFQNRHGFDVMILSPKAGGVGLNLTAANHVIHLSRWWNPAVEDQCTDRVFRIGQKLPVHVHYPLSIHPEFQESSFDVKVDKLLNRKRKLSHELLSSPEPTKQEAEDLFNETVRETKWEPGLLDKIDLFEPSAFEEWVCESLSKENFDTKLTPRSYDRRADVVAIAPNHCRSFLIQCKHTQTNNLCSVDAIKEICNSKEYYTNLSDPVELVVITNSRGFNSDAIKLAEEKKVRLIKREQLQKLVHYITL